MVRWARLAVAGAVAACAGACLFPDLSKLAGDAGGAPDAQGDVGADAADASDAGADGDAAAPRCDPHKPFATVAPIAELDTADDEYKMTLSPDELEIWFGFTQKTDSGSNALIEIKHARRASLGAAFGAPTAEANLAPGDVDPAVTDDALGLYYSKFGTVGNWDLFYATRADRASPFGLGVQLPSSLQSTGADTAGFVAFDGSLWFSSDRATSGESGIYRAPLVDGGLAAPAVVASLTSGKNDSGVVVTHDGLFAYVSSNRTDLGTEGGYDIFLAERATTSDAFGTPVDQTEISGPSAERANWISFDSCRLYFESTRNGGQSDVFVATKSP